MIQNIAQYPGHDIASPVSPLLRSCCNKLQHKLPNARSFDLSPFPRSVLSACDYNPMFPTTMRRQFVPAASSAYRSWARQRSWNGPRNTAMFRSSAVASAKASDAPLCMPHSHISTTKRSEDFLLRLLDRLWEKYRSRVSYVRTYEEIVKASKATFVNDHIAFRSIALQSQNTGIPSVSRLFEALGYRASATYSFEDKHLSAIHFEHPRAIFPKLFISELKVWELSAASRDICTAALASHRPHLPDSLLADLHGIQSETILPSEAVLDAAADAILSLPWDIPEEDAVRGLHAESQYGAWVLVHGYNVNHFTALINSHGVANLSSIEDTVAALKSAGVPMKTQIESDSEGRLRQTATQAVNIPIRMARKWSAGVVEVEWPYAYFELAQRDPFKDHDGSLTRFEGFLSANATHLFDMTQGSPK